MHIFDLKIMTSGDAGQLTWRCQLLGTQHSLIHIHILEELIEQSLAAQLLLLIRELLAITAAATSKMCNSFEWCKGVRKLTIVTLSRTLCAVAAAKPFKTSVATMNWHERAPRLRRLCGLPQICTAGDRHARH